MHPDTAATLTMLSEFHLTGVSADGAPTLTSAIGDLIRTRADAIGITKGLLAEVDHKGGPVRGRALELLDALHRQDRAEVIERSMALAILTVPADPIAPETGVRLAIEAICDWVERELVP